MIACIPSLCLNQVLVRAVLSCLSALLSHPATHSWLLPTSPKFLSDEAKVLPALMRTVKLSLETNG